jgi:hypothetical protein
LGWVDGRRKQRKYKGLEWEYMGLEDRGNVRVGVGIQGVKDKRGN